MKNDLRKQAVFGALIKDNTTDWKNVANKEIEENKNLKDKITSLEAELVKRSSSDLLEVDPKLCRNWKYADRNKFELGNIDELAEDIRINGQLQPAIIRKIESLDYKYEVIAGERRWRACQIAGVNLKAIITEEDDTGCLVIQTSENKKKSLSPYSLAITYEKLMSDLGISQSELARKLNIPKTSFSELMAFNKVPQRVWEAVEDMTNVKPRTAAFLALTCDKGPQYQDLIIKYAPQIKEGIGVDSINKLIEKHMQNIKTSRNSSRPYANKQGEILFRITSEGRISLSKSVLNKVDLDSLGNHISKYLESIS